MFVSSATPPSTPSAHSVWLLSGPDGLLVTERDGAIRLPTREETASLGIDPRTSHYLGRLDGADCWAAPSPASPQVPSSALQPRSLRALSVVLSAEEFAVAGRAVQVVHWEETHRFCGRCGRATERVADERSRVCPKCALRTYPRISPAVIMLIHRNDEVLLARSAKFPIAFYSVLAGFVEPGETLEETVIREVREEVGVEIEPPRYFGSQSWPFPSSLMVAFDARWSAGEPRADGVELNDAGWYRDGALPPIPPSISIARQLIEAWRAGAFRAARK